MSVKSKSLVVALTVVVLNLLPADTFGAGYKPKQQQQEKKKSETAPPPAKQTVTIPAVNMTGLTDAKKEAAATHANEKKALNAVNQIRGKLMKAADAKPEIVEATKAAAAAKTAYDAATAPVVGTLDQRADYKALQAAVVKADQEIATLKADKEATPETRVAAAAKAKESRNGVSEMRTEALAADPKITAAKQKYEEAAEVVTKLRSDFQKSISDDPDLVAALKSLDEAKTKSKEADQKVANANADIGKQKQARETAMAEQRKLDREYAQARQQQRSGKSR
jgi:hypothetical protein